MTPQNRFLDWLCGFMALVWIIMADAWQPEGNLLVPATLVALVTTIGCLYWKFIRARKTFFMVGIVLGVLITTIW